MPTDAEAASARSEESSGVIVVADVSVSGDPATKDAVQQTVDPRPRRRG
jgi:hypothetical protein